jgi:hypothetical protein
MDAFFKLGMLAQGMSKQAIIERTDVTDIRDDIARPKRGHAGIYGRAAMRGAAFGSVAGGVTGGIIGMLRGERGSRMQQVAKDALRGVLSGAGIGAGVSTGLLGGLQGGAAVDKLIDPAGKNLVTLPANILAGMGTGVIAGGALGNYGGRAVADKIIGDDKEDKSKKKPEKE